MGKVRTFAELTAGVASKAGISKSDAGKALVALCDEIAETLKAGQIFRLRDIGNMRLLVKKARLARNPFTGEQFQSPEGLRVKFNVGSALKALAKNPKGVKAESKKAEAPKPVVKGKPEVKAAEKPVSKQPTGAKPPEKKPAGKPAPVPIKGTEADELEKMLAGE